MGTNYYAMFNRCEHCGRADRVHIGKSSFGWKFSFHAPDGIRSWKDWQAKLVGVRIEDEYDKLVTLTELQQLVAAKMDGKDHINECMHDMHGAYMTQRVADGDEWHDEEGLSFSRGEFS